MAKILDLREERRHLKAKKGFRNWARRFPESFDTETSSRELSDATLAVLIRGGEDSSMPLYEFIMGVLGLGKGPRFYHLETSDIMVVTDITLFLLDQLRFEAMKRLGWIEDVPILHVPLIDLVEKFAEHYSGTKNDTPALSPKHPRYQEYQQTFVGDRSAFVRKLIPEVIEVFQERADGA